MQTLKTTTKYTLILLTAFVVLALGFYLRLEHAGEVDTAYSIANSARFNDDDSAYLSRTPASAGNRKTWTWSGWVKRGNLGSHQTVYSAAYGNLSRYFNIRFRDDDALSVFSGLYTAGGSTSTQFDYKTNALFRDPSAWHHIFLSVDTTLATATDRVKIYIDGELVTSFVSEVDPSQNSEGFVNSTIAQHNVSGEWFGSLSFPVDGYLSSVNFIDGLALTPTDFGETDTNGYWRPKAYSGAYGTNGFHLDFANSADLGNDVSGQNNDWTSNNMDATDQVIDTPTNSFATLNPLDNGGALMSEGGLKVVANGGSHLYSRSTFQLPTSGKWYWEVTSTWNSSSRNGAGIVPATTVNSSYPWGTVGSFGFYLGSDTSNWYWSQNGTLAWNVIPTSPATFQFAYDADKANLYVGINNTYYDDDGTTDGNPSSLLNATNSTLISGGNFPIAGVYGSQSQLGNFGANALTGLTYYASAGGYFKYEPPTGFKALSTNNLPTTFNQYDDSVLMLHGDGTDTSTTFTDSSGGKHAITANGDAQIDTAQSKFGGSSMLFDGAGDGLSIVDDGDFDFGSGDFTIDAWARFASASGGETIAGSSGSGETFFRRDDSNQIVLGRNTVANDSISSVLTWAADTWYHLAVVRTNGVVKFFRDGTEVFSGANTNSYNVSTLYIGKDYYAGQETNGHIDDLRITKGLARWTADFTPPTSAHSTYTEEDIITQPSNYFEATTYTGTGAFQSITSLNFTPALTWLKDRTSANSHGLFDTLRKAIPYLSTNSTGVEVAASDALTSFNNDGFTLGTNALFNTNGNDYISWNWAEDVESGFDIVNYVGNGLTSQSVSHSLGAAPSMMILKQREAGGNNWQTYHRSLGDTKAVFLDTTDAAITSSAYWNNTSPTSDTFTIGNSNNANNGNSDYIAYLFAEKPGYSKFGSYTGNGSIDGPFVHLGFKPRYVMVKGATCVTNWPILDSARLPHNEMDGALWGNLANVEGTSGYNTDFLTNGFKVRDTNGGYNTDGCTFIYAAFAEQPFKESAEAYNTTITNSARFNDDDSAYLSRTPASAGNRKTWTWSGWVKQGNLGASRSLFHATGATNDNDNTGILFREDDTLMVNGHTLWWRRTSQVFRDPSKWTHIVVALDTTQVTAGDRIKIYADGEEITSFSTTNNPSLNMDLAMNATHGHYLASNSDQASTFDGYLSTVNFIDGQALTPTDFGELDTNDYWRPKAYAGAYGTNGFHLDFANSADLGNDVSGNSNDWTSNNMDATDQVIDTPTNSFATLSAIDGTATNSTLSDGSLKRVGTSNYSTEFSTISLTSGKYYWETTVDAIGGVPVRWASGVVTEDFPRNVTGQDALLGFGGGIDPDEAIAYHGDGTVKNDAVTIQTFSSLAATDILNVALDADTGKLWFGKNGTWQGGGDPATGASPADTFPASKTYTPGFGGYNTAEAQVANFGANALTGLTYYASAGGYFKYAPPTGYKALSTNNLPTTFNEYDDSVLMLHGDGTDASTTFTDSSGSKHSVTASGNAQIDTTQADPFGGNSGVMQFDGSTDYLTVSDNSKLDFGTGDFTIDYWINYSEARNCSLLGGDTVGDFDVRRYSDNTLRMGRVNTAFDSTSSVQTWTNGAWYHVAVVRSSGVLKMFKDGIEIYSGTNTQSYNIASTLNIGDLISSAEFYGYADDIRITKGLARWTSAFTPPTSAHTTYTEENIITQPSNYFNATTYTGTGAIQSITSLNFQPALTWLKDRTSANSHGLFDSLRQTIPYLSSDSNAVETSSPSALQSFLENGFSIGGNALFNTDGNDYISWNWKESVESGFDVVSYAGDGTNARSISHSLGSQPKMILLKNRGAGVASWKVYHQDLPTGYQLELDNTGAQDNGVDVFNSVTPTTGVFQVNNSSVSNNTGSDYTAYLFAEKPGYSKFGSYTGNGSADGPFVHLGFKPKWVMIKRSSNSGSWYTYDTERDIYNIAGKQLFPNQSNNELSTNSIDILSNGFKIRTTASEHNQSGQTIIYAAFAEQPFNLSAAPASTNYLQRAASFLLGMEF